MGTSLDNMSLEELQQLRTRNVDRKSQQVSKLDDLSLSQLQVLRDKYGQGSRESLTPAQSLDTPVPNLQQSEPLLTYKSVDGKEQSALPQPDVKPTLGQRALDSGGAVLAGFTTGAIDAAIKMGSLANKGITKGVNTILGTNLQSPDVNQVRSVSEPINKVYVSGNPLAYKVGNALGQVSPTLMSGGILGGATIGAWMGAADVAADNPKARAGDIALGGLKTGAETAVGYGVASGLGHIIGGAFRKGETVLAPASLSQTERAGEGMVADLGMPTSRTTAQVRTAAQDTLKDVGSGTKPIINTLYKNIENTKIRESQLSDLTSKYPEGSFGSTVLQLAAKNSADLAKDLPPASMQRFDLMKRSLDSTITKLDNPNLESYDAARASALKTIRSDLIGALDKANPDYKLARVLSGNNIEELKNLSNGPLGKLADTDQRVGNWSKNLFKTSTPEEFTDVVTRLQQTDPKLLDTMTARYIKDLTSLQSKSNNSITPNDLRLAVLKTPEDTKRILVAVGNNPINAAKFEVARELFQKIDPKVNPGGWNYVSSVFLSLRRLSGEPAVIFNNKMTKFLTDKTMNNRFMKIVNNGKSQDEIVEETVKMLMTPDRAKLPGIKAATGFGLAQIADNLITPVHNKDGTK